MTLRPVSSSTAFVVGSLMASWKRSLYWRMSLSSPTDNSVSRARERPRTRLIRATSDSRIKLRAYEEALCNRSGRGARWHRLRPEGTGQRSPVDQRRPHARRGVRDAELLQQRCLEV